MRSTALLLLFGSLISGCDSPDNYLPLSGNQTLTYDLTQIRSGDTYRQKMLTRIDGPATIADHEDVYREFTVSGIHRLLQRQAGGVYEIGYHTATGPEFLAEPRLLLPQPLSENSRWQSPVTTNLLEWRKHTLEKSGRRFLKTFTVTFQCESLDERIKTPAGTFNKVARISAQGQKTIEYGSLQEQAVIHVELTRWYAPGVGLIKNERREYADSRELNPGNSTTILERID